MFSRAVYAPTGLATLNAVIAPTWPTSTVPAANARTPSKSGNRGLPGGGATASGAAERPTVRAAYAPARHRLARVTRPLAFRGTLALVALAALAIRTGATLRHRDYPVIGDALTFHLEGGYLAHGEGFRRIFEAVPTAEHAAAVHLPARAVHAARGRRHPRAEAGARRGRRRHRRARRAARAAGRGRPGRAAGRRGRCRPSAAVARRRRADERVAVRPVHRRRAA